MQRHMLKVIISLLAIAAVGLAIWIVTTRAIVAQRVPFKSQSEFIVFADQNQLPDRTPIEKYAIPHCSSGDSSYDSGCTLSKSFIYKLERDYKTEGKEIFSYLKSKGFDFRSPSKYIKQTADTLNNETIAANMKNTEPIIVDLYHNKRDARVRVYLGDQGRTLPYAKGSGIDSIGLDQLIAGIYFYSP